VASVGRTAAVILFLAAVAAAAPLARGTRFGMVGLDYRISGGSVYDAVSGSTSADPFFRVGSFVSSNLAIGADLALLGTFPREGDLFVSTPVFAFGPVATWIPVHSGRVQAYGTVGANVVYNLVRRQGWRGRAGAGALFDIGIPVTFGPEVGFYADFVHIATSHRSIWDSGYTFFIGLRLSDLRL
jgi:hypothetical protein